MNDAISRFLNAKNEHQGPLLKVLCVCSAGLLRSPTIAWVLSNPPWNCNTRAVGANPSYALCLLEDVHVYWADAIVVANGEDDIMDAVNCHMAHEVNKGKKLYNLNLPDVYNCRSTQLIQAVQEALESVNFVGTPGDVYP